MYIIITIIEPASVRTPSFITPIYYHTKSIFLYIVSRKIIIFTGSERLRYIHNVMHNFHHTCTRSFSSSQPSPPAPTTSSLHVSLRKSSVCVICKVWCLNHRNHAKLVHIPEDWLQSQGDSGDFLVLEETAGLAIAHH